LGALSVVGWLRFARLNEPRQPATRGTKKKKKETNPTPHNARSEAFGSELADIAGDADE
jgi:hypothetical protein